MRQVEDPRHANVRGGQMLWVVVLSTTRADDSPEGEHESSEAAGGFLATAIGDALGQIPLG